LVIDLIFEFPRDHMLPRVKKLIIIFLQRFNSVLISESFSSNDEHLDL